MLYLNGIQALFRQIGSKVLVENWSNEEIYAERFLFGK
jgi:hypothetical protein